jgi:hypothetical protein
MFPFPIAKPQKCDIQTFYGAPDISNFSNQKTWNKPVGVSHVYIMVIGGGGNGDGTNGGGSGAVTIWYGAAQHVPNALIVLPSTSNDSSVIYNSSYSQLLVANGGNNFSGGQATTAGPFAASGFYKSTAGQDGISTQQNPSQTTFLSGGGSGVTGNYGYLTNTAGFFQMQPIVVGVGSTGSFKGAIGCGGGQTALIGGGPGMVLIASW